MSCLQYLVIVTEVESIRVDKVLEFLLQALKTTHCFTEFCTLAMVSVIHQYKLDETLIDATLL